jgi:hypothetical protein
LLFADLVQCQQLYSGRVPWVHTDEAVNGPTSKLLGERRQTRPDFSCTTGSFSGGGQCPTFTVCNCAGNGMMETCSQQYGANCAAAFAALAACLNATACFESACNGGSGGGNTGDVFNINVSITGSMDGHTNIQVCIDAAGNCEFRTIVNAKIGPS